MTKPCNPPALHAAFDDLPVGAVAEGETNALDQALTHSVTQPDDREGVEPPYYAVAFILRTS
jgi:hypothetical protein